MLGKRGNIREAENKQEAEELATEQCGFPYVDYCEIEE